MSSPREAAVLACLLSLAAMGLQGCGGDCPVAEEGPHKLSREEAVTNMLCTDAVAGELAKIETKALDNLKKECLGVIENVTNMPKGKFQVEKHCERWGANNFLDTHMRCEQFMMANCTAWAAERMQQPENTTGRVKHLFDAATDCLTAYDMENGADLEIAKGYYDEALKRSIKDSRELVHKLKEMARKVMNDQLAEMDDTESKFYMTPAAAAASSRTPSLSTLTLLGVPTCVGVGLLVLRHVVRASSDRDRSIVAVWATESMIPEASVE